MAEPKAAVAVVHAPISESGNASQNREESVLLIRRTERQDDPWSGHWSFPGGRREPEDEDLVETALRELAEECGIVLGRESLEKCLTPAAAGRRVGRVITVAPFLFHAPAEQTLTLDPEEAAQALWVPLSLLRDPSRHCLTPVQRLPKGAIFPAIQLNGVPLWGFTYRVLMEWLGMHAPCPPPEKPGFRAAQKLLDFLLASGLELRQGWSETNGAACCRVARVKGAIPVPCVLSRMAWPDDPIPPISSLDIQPGSIRLVGLDFEEYLIESGG